MKVLNKTEINYLLKPFIILVSVVILIIITGVIAYSQISTLANKLNESKASENSLGQKYSILQRVSDIVSENTTFLDVVVPSRNASLYGISQVKNQGAKFNLVITNLRTGAPSPIENNVFKQSISFDVTGEEESIYNFMKSFNESLPIMVVDKAKFTATSPVAIASLSVNVFSSALPETIPSVTSEVVDFTEEEVSLLRRLGAYQMPAFTEPRPTEVTPKEDPFN